MKTIVLFTDSYPYGEGEIFLEKELMMSSGYDKMYIVPLNPNSDIKTKLIPDKAEIITVEKQATSKFDSIKAAFSPFVFKEIIENLSFPRKIKELLFFCRKAKSMSKSIEKALPSLDGQDVVLYSYWLFTGAVVIADLKKALSGKCNSVKAVSRAHRYDLYEYRNELNYLPLRRYILNKLDKVFPCSNNGRDYLSNRYPSYSHKIETAYLGTKDNSISLGGKQNGFHIVSCSYISPVKRIPLIIDALSNLNIDVIWSHIGGGQSLDEIREATKNLSGNIKVELLGNMNNDEIMQYYKNTQVSLFVNVSESEGLPVSIMEAISFGVPVLATDVGGTSEAVIDGYNGYLIDKNTSGKQIAEKILEIYNLEDSIYSKLCKNSREHWDSNFNSAKNYEQFYSTLCE